MIQSNVLHILINYAGFQHSRAPIHKKNLMTKKIIVYPDGEPDSADQIGQSGLQKLNRLGDFQLHDNTPSSDEEFIQRIEHAHGLILGWNLPATVMAAARNLEIISFTGIGVAKFVDMAQAEAQGICVCNTTGYGDAAVAEHTMALLFAVAKNIPSHHHRVNQGKWDQSIDSLELAGKTIGLIGFGGIGQYFAKLAHGMGMKVIAWTRSPERYQQNHSHVEFKSFENVLSESDVVSLHLAHHPTSEGIIDANAFAMLKPGSIFINAARGELVDEYALAAAIESGHIRGAGLDVFCEEPLPSSHPLFDLPNTVITPHIAYNTPEAANRLHQFAIDNIINFYAGHPTNIVTTS